MLERSMLSSTPGKCDAWHMRRRINACMLLVDALVHA
jgi:hypothetical protein